MDETTVPRHQTAPPAAARNATRSNCVISLRRHIQPSLLDIDQANLKGVISLRGCWCVPGRLMLVLSHYPQLTKEPGIQVCRNSLHFIVGFPLRRVVPVVTNASGGHFPD